MAGISNPPRLRVRFCITPHLSYTRDVHMYVTEMVGEDSESDLSSG